MASPNCREVEPVLACFSPTDTTQPKVAIAAHYLYDANRAALGVYYTDETGALFDAAAGTVSLGACPTYQPDVEWEQLCDKLADGTIIEFMCRTITYFDTMGNPVDPPLVTNFEMDKVTPYTPIEPVDCSACCVDVPQGVITDLSLLADCLA